MPKTLHHLTGRLADAPAGATAPAWVVAKMESAARQQEMD